MAGGEQERRCSRADQDWPSRALVATSSTTVARSHRSWGRLELLLQEADQGPHHVVGASCVAGSSGVRTPKNIRRDGPTAGLGLDDALRVLGVLLDGIEEEPADGIFHVELILER